MFNFLKRNPTKALRKQYAQKLEQAMNAQRKGDMRLYAELTDESEKIWAEIERVEAAQ
ncbi:DUF6435 family protein [Aliidiomarina celeris]|uniref:DUF6435 family protein n=1 Tax=Aliidiomarina celeris TaxID=2249428 RepID=UPI000DE818E7|nr:DUF6435 family protein [Aliidiomarina celeris]